MIAHLLWRSLREHPDLLGAATTIVPARGDAVQWAIVIF